MPSAPKILDAIADRVLRYRPKPKSKPAKRRKRRAAKLLTLDDEGMATHEQSDLIAPRRKRKRSK